MDKKIEIIKKVILSGVVFGAIDVILLIIFALIENSTDEKIFGFSFSLVLLALFSTFIGGVAWFLINKKLRLSAWTLLIAGLGILLSSSWIGIIPFILFVIPSIYVIINENKLKK